MIPSCVLTLPFLATFRSLFLLTYVLLLVGFAQAAFVVGTKGKKGTAALVKMNRKLATNAKAEREPPSQGGAGGLVLPPL